MRAFGCQLLLRPKPHFAAAFLHTLTTQHLHAPIFNCSLSSIRRISSGVCVNTRTCTCTPCTSHETPMPFRTCTCTQKGTQKGSQMGPQGPWGPKRVPSTPKGTTQSTQQGTHKVSPMGPQKGTPKGPRGPQDPKRVSGSPNKYPVPKKCTQKCTQKGPKKGTGSHQRPAVSGTIHLHQRPQLLAVRVISTHCQDVGVFNPSAFACNVLPRNFSTSALECLTCPHMPTTTFEGFLLAFV